jgi:hypothetical protein
VAGAASSTRRKAASLALLTLGWVGCAKIEDPPGGPPDYAAPVLLAVAPDSGSVMPDFDDDLEFQFNEVISERSGGGLENLIQVSPRPEELRVGWKRTRVTVRPKDGWHRDIVYHVTLLPGVADLRNNRLDSSRTVIFSTGGPIPNTRLSGTVLDWEAGRAAARALLEAVLLPDSLVYQSSADSLGDFELTAIPPGEYLLNAVVDGNNNQMRDSREAFDSVTVRIDSTFDHVFWAFTHDTTGPQISDVADPDSFTVRVGFNQALLAQDPPDSAVQVYALPDTTPVAVVAVWSQQVYDSVSAVEAAVADSIAAAVADSIAAAVADSIAAAVADSIRAAAEAEGDTLVVDSLTAPEEEQPAEPGAAAAEEVAQDTSAAAADSVSLQAARVDSLLAIRPALSSAWYVRIAEQLTPGGRYLVTATATNLLGVTAESLLPLILPESAPPDST